MGAIDREEINGYTKATADDLKRAILAAMPEGGIDQAALDAAVTEILNGIPDGGGLSSCIRKIQRGTFIIPATSGSVTVALSGFSDVKKMFVLLDGSAYYKEEYTDSMTHLAILPYVSALTATKLTVGSNYWKSSGYSTTGSYQVIEFY